MRGTTRKVVLGAVAGGWLSVGSVSCTSELLTGAIQGAADTATDIVFSGLRDLYLTGGSGDNVLDYVFSVTETIFDESLAQGIDRAVPDDPEYD